MLSLLQGLEESCVLAPFHTAVCYQRTGGIKPSFPNSIYLSSFPPGYHIFQCLWSLFLIFSAHLRLYSHRKENLSLLHLMKKINSDCTNFLKEDIEMENSLKFRFWATFEEHKLEKNNFANWINTIPTWWICVVKGLCTHQDLGLQTMKSIGSKKAYIAGRNVSVWLGLRKGLTA